jgi:hypothetical protein
VGRSRDRRTAFFASHPLCCFCGGVTPATEEDHQPGRVFFRDREWPEGFVFPACSACNAVSRYAETAASVLACSVADDFNRSQYRSRVASLRMNRPDLIAGMGMTANEKRGALKRLGLEPPPGVTILASPSCLL